MAGRKPKPTAVKKLEGNPGKRKLNTKEPNPGKGMPDCPAWLLPEAKTEWIRLSDKLNQMRVLTEIDRSAFAAYCQSYARWKEAQEHINSEGATYETENGMQRPNPWVATPLRMSFIRRRWIFWKAGVWIRLSIRWSTD